jgi:hypothetical protein
MSAKSAVSIKTVSSALAAAAAVLLTGTAAAAQEYCVACSEPTAVYRCVIDNAQPGGSQPLQVLCVSALAKAGGHGQCAIKRGTVFDCNGPVKRIPWTGAAGDTPAPIATPKPSVPPATDPKEPPQTVQEMTDRANKKTSDDMKQAGDTFKDKAKKTLDCVASLFFKC